MAKSERKNFNDLIDDFRNVMLVTCLANRIHARYRWQSMASLLLGRVQWGQPLHNVWAFCTSTPV